MHTHERCENPWDQAKEQQEVTKERRTHRIPSFVSSTSFSSAEARARSGPSNSSCPPFKCLRGELRWAGGQIAPPLATPSRTTERWIKTDIGSKRTLDQNTEGAAGVRTKIVDKHGPLTDNGFLLLPPLPLFFTAAGSLFQQSTCSAAARQGAETRDGQPSSSSICVSCVPTLL